MKRLGRLPTADCLRFALDVASGLTQLHQRGLVHRDVKPGNIIFVNGRAKLADIGLVSIDGEGRTFVGTEGYIPPEGPGSPMADIYALGIALYEASTGFSPDQFPDAPPEWFAETSGDDALELHWIILKACEGQKENRYQNIEALQADLAMLQSGQSVRRVRGLERRLVRLKIIAAVAGLTLLIAAGLVALAGYRAREAAATRAKETHLRERAEAAEREAKDRLHGAYLDQARATVLSGEIGRRFRTLEAVRQAAVIRNAPELRREAFAALALPDLGIERTIDLGADADEAAVDRDFHRYAVARGEGDIEVRAVADDRLLMTLPASTNLGAHLLRFSGDGRHLAFKRDHGAGDDSDLEVWNLSTKRRVIRATHAAANNALSFHPNAAKLLVGRPSGRLVQWNLETGQEEISWRLPPHWCVAYSPEGGRFALARPVAVGAIVEIFNATNASLIASNWFPRDVFKIAWHPNGQQLAVPCSDGSVNLMDAASGTIRALGLHKAQAVEAAFSPQGDFLVSGGWDNEINVWNLRNHQRELSAALGGISLGFHREGRRAALVAKNSRLLLLDFSAGTESQSWDLPDSMSLAARRGAFSPNGRWLAVPTKEGVAVWPVDPPGRPAFIVSGGLGAIVWLPGGDEFIGPDETRLFRWKVSPGVDAQSAPRLEAGPIFAPRDRIYSAHWLARERALLFSGVEGLQVVPLAQLGSGEGRRRKSSLWISAVAPDESWIAAPYYRTPVVRIFRTADFVVERALTNAAPVRAIACAPNGDRLAVLTQTSLCVWNTKSWQIHQTLPLTTDAFAQVSYSGDGKILLVTENARTSSLRRAETLEPLLPLPVWRQPNAMSADGRHLALNVEGRRMQLWDLQAVRARFRELGIDWAD